MSMSQTALKLVQKSLPRLHLCKDTLVLPPTGHILRGFTFERTPYKETFYLWRLVLPLYRFEMLKVLSYSKRIPKGAYVHLSKTDPVQSAREVASIISDDIPHLELVQTPRDFLDHVGWMIGNDRPDFLLDLGATYFLVGRCHEAFLALQEASAEAERHIARHDRNGSPNDRLIDHLTELRRAADDLARNVRSDPAAAMQTIKGWEERSITQFDLARTVCDTTPT